MICQRNSVCTGRRGLTDATTEPTRPGLSANPSRNRSTTIVLVCALTRLAKAKAKRATVDWYMKMEVETTTMRMMSNGVRQRCVTS